MGQFVGLADDEGFKGKARVERRGLQRLGQAVGLIRGGRLGRGGGWSVGRFRGRISGRGGTAHGAGRGVRGHLERHPLHRLTRRGQLVEDQVREILIDVIPHEAGRHMKHRDPVVQLGKLERFDPGLVIVLAHRFQKPLPQLSPFLLRHPAPHIP